jgi:hypothetical protein
MKAIEGKAQYLQRDSAKLGILFQVVFCPWVRVAAKRTL